MHWPLPGLQPLCAACRARSSRNQSLFFSGAAVAAAAKSLADDAIGESVAFVTSRRCTSPSKSSKNKSPNAFTANSLKLPWTSHLHSPSNFSNDKPSTSKLGYIFVSRSNRANPYQSVAHFAFPSARARIAIRVGTPLWTSSTMTDCGQSATSAVNSRPRMIGPGCITIASRFASFNRADVI
jgi:hypothetical protein